MCIQLIAYGLPAHKEFRFLLPAIQLAMPYCGLGAAYLIEDQKKHSKSTNKKNSTATPPSFVSSPTVRKRFAIAMLGLQVPVTLFFSLYHQRAQVQVMSYLQKSQRSPASTQTLSVLFLTPCHTTPYYSYIHQEIPMRFLDCSPPGMLKYSVKDPSSFLLTLTLTRKISPVLSLSFPIVRRMV